MKGLVKFIFKSILALVLLVVALILTVPIWLGPVVKPALKTAVPKFTKTSFDLRSFDLNPYTGRFAIGGLALGNPEGYSEPTALSIGSLEIDVAMLSLAGETVHIERLELDDLFVSYVSGGEAGANNFDQIAENVTVEIDREAAERKAAEKAAEEQEPQVKIPGLEVKISKPKIFDKAGELFDKAGKAKTEKTDREEVVAEKEIAEKAGADKSVVEKTSEEESAAEIARETRVVIDELVIRDIRGKFGAIPFSLPAITLHGVGEKDGGVTMEELGAIIWASIMSGVASLGEGLQQVAEGALSVGTNAVENVVSVGTNVVSDVVSVGATTAESTIEAVKNADMSGAQKALESAKEQLKGVSDQLKNVPEQFKDAGEQLKDAGKILNGFLR